MKKKELWQDLALDAFKRRCKERVAKSNAIHAAEIEERKNKEEDERLSLMKLSELRNKSENATLPGS